MGNSGRGAEGLRITHAADRERYEALLDDHLIGVLQYGPGSHEDARDILSTVVDPEHGRRGIGTALVRTAIADAEEAGLDIEATCWFAHGYLERHPGHGAGTPSDEPSPGEPSPDAQTPDAREGRS
ncbi:N-acetyltransferase [Brachybacterium endophyticum]|uniref:N-acetyltransferase n=1 Tax=Brachybacterium endophyticum TaxID=2182385 RepID=A0A2U2RM01_9MICO|nr:GNAT family N-acetyltransferase [Brachybacterium endophyticum]PWH06903.1 N-acetyltransferase [Brachybacterium endophyticum]